MVRLVWWALWVLVVQEKLHWQNTFTTTLKSRAIFLLKCGFVYLNLGTKLVSLIHFGDKLVGNTGAGEMGHAQVVERLYSFLSSKTYLAVIDDIWSIDAWYDISQALPDVNGSKVVVTTRNKFLPLNIDPRVHVVEPKCLSDEESYELFKKRAYLDKNTPHDLLSLGKQMVKKCKGLPLAIVALSGLLGRDKRKISWERIHERLKDNILGMANESTQGVVKDILALSFYELPISLKPCVRYLHLFPEDDVIEAKPLVQM